MGRIRVTHTGSLIRPQELLDLLAPKERGDAYDEHAYAETLRTAVAGSVRRQAAAGVDVVDDGEMGKASWITYLYERVSGLEPRRVPAEGRTMLPPSRDRQAFPGFYAEHDAEFERAYRASVGAEPAQHDAAADTKIWVCTGPLTYQPSLLERDITNLRSAVEGLPVSDAFLPVVAPASANLLVNEHYSTEEEFVFALADALHEEYRIIVDAGFLLQVDDAALMHACDSILARGGSLKDYRKWAELRVEALNHALSGIPEERVRYHICWGSWHGPHAYDPPLADVVDLVLKVNAGAYVIEQANARHEHEWQVWETVPLPEGKKLIPGVVTHHTNIVEHPELVATRLTRLATLVGRDHVQAGTDCGFAQGAFVRRVHPDIQWAKLEALAAGARLASERLWGRRSET